MGNENPFSVKIDLGIAEVVRVVDGIFTRRHNRNTEALADFASNLADDLDASSEIVKALDDFFIKLVRGFSSTKITQDPVMLSDHVEETRKYLSQRELLPRLEECIGAIKAASLDSRLKSRGHSELVRALRSLASRLQLYRENLGRGARTGVGQTEDWNLETLCERALACSYGGGRLALSVDEIAEEVSRNHDFDVSDNIHRLVGTARMQAQKLAHNTPTTT
jgi:hypothetical protein